MDAPLRLLVYVDRYWPLADDRQRRLTEQLVVLSRLGVRPVVVTIAQEAGWPPKLWHREIPIIRPVVHARGDWAFGRFSRALQRWLRDQVPGFDVVYIDQLGKEGALFAEAAREHRRPLIARHAAAVDRESWLRQLSSRSTARHLHGCLQANAVVAPTAIAGQQLLAAGVLSRHVRRIDDSLPVAVVARGPGVRAAARAALAEICGDLYAAADTPVVLCLTRLLPSGGAMTVADAMIQLVHRNPSIRCWLVGDGPTRNEIDRLLWQAGVRHAVSLPGTFDTTEDLLQAADCLLIPTLQEGLEADLGWAISAGLPIVAPHHAEVQAWIGEAENAMLFDPRGGIKAIVEAIEASFRDPAAAAQRAISARNWALAKRPPGRSAAQLLRLIEELTASAQSGTLAEAAH